MTWTPDQPFTLTFGSPVGDLDGVLRVLRREATRNIRLDSEGMTSDQPTGYWRLGHSPDFSGMRLRTPLCQESNWPEIVQVLRTLTYAAIPPQLRSSGVLPVGLDARGVSHTRNLRILTGWYLYEELLCVLGPATRDAAQLTLRGLWTWTDFQHQCMTPGARVVQSTDRMIFGFNPRAYAFECRLALVTFDPATALSWTTILQVLYADWASWNGRQHAAMLDRGMVIFTRQLQDLRELLNRDLAASRPQLLAIVLDYLDRRITAYEQRRAREL